MKKLFCFALLILLLIFQCTSCSAGSINEESNATQSEALLPPVRYIFYVGSKYDPTVYDLEEMIPADSSAIRAPESERNFAVGSTVDIGTTDPSTHKSELTIDGKTYSLNYVESYKIALSESEDHSQYSCFDKYFIMKGDTKKGEVTINQVTGEIATFHDYTVGSELEGPVTREEARKKAEELLSSLYGEEIFNYYKYNEKSESSEYYFELTRYVFGIPANDVICIRMNKLGQVEYIGATSKWHYYNAEAKLTQAHIDAAIAELNKIYSDKYTIDSNITMVVDSKGYYFLKTMLSYYSEVRADTHKHIRKLYINIQ